MRSITTCYYRLIVIGLLVIRMDLTSARSDQHYGPQHDVNICVNQDQLRCPDGHVISVLAVTCGGSGRPCVTPLNQTVADICDGHQTCSNLGLTDMFSSHCTNHLADVNCTFKCVPGKTAKCRSNICAPQSQGLICPPKSTIHIRGVTCSGGDGRCSWSSYNLLTSLCEGAGHCAASGLRLLLSPHCNERKKQVLVEYLCIPAKFIYNSCSSFRYRPISTDFGILRLPAITKTAKTTKLENTKKCKWMIAAYEKQRPIKVNVLLVQSQVFQNGCDPNFLRIQLMDCAKKKVVLRSFCNLKDSSVALTSCGPIKITSSASSQKDGSYQFIISYQNLLDSEPESFVSSGLSTCVVTPPTVPSVLTLPANPDHTHRALHNSEPDDARPEDTVLSGSFKMNLKVLLLYIFLGALILILVAALITVLVRYHRISSPKNNYDSCENVVLWKRYEDTAADVFQQNRLGDHTGPFDHPDTRYNSDQVIATVHHDPVPEQDEYDVRISCGSGFSSFLPPKRDSGFKDLLDSFQMGSFGMYNNMTNDADRKSQSVSKYDYYELPEQGVTQDIYQPLDEDSDLQFDGHYSNPNSLSRQPKPFSYGKEDEHRLVAIEDYQPLVIPEICPRDAYHYTVNDDEYAVVNKSQKPPKTGINNFGAKTHSPNIVHSSNGFVDFHPTSGPYGKTNSNSSHRKSWERKWRDEV